MTQKRHCEYCIRWYFTGDDQCNIPACGLDKDQDLMKTTKLLHKIIWSKEQKPSQRFSQVDIRGQVFAREHLEYIHFHRGNTRKIYGHPSELNKNNDCYFYKALPRALRFLTRLVRFFYS